MSLEQYKDASRKELWNILQIQMQVLQAETAKVAELENPWISVDDEMPSAEHAIVIVDFYGGNVGVGYPHKGKILDEPMGMLFNGVTHWQPMPAPLKEKEDE